MKNTVLGISSIRIFHLNMWDLLKDRIERGDVEVVDIDKNRDGKELAKVFGGVPTLIEEENGIVHEMFLTDNPQEKVKK